MKCDKELFNSIIHLIYTLGFVPLFVLLVQSAGLYAFVLIPIWFLSYCCFLWYCTPKKPSANTSTIPMYSYPYVLPAQVATVEEDPHRIHFFEPPLHEAASGGEILPPPQYDDVVSEGEEELQRVILELSGPEQDTALAEFVPPDHNEENELERMGEDFPPAYDIAKGMP